MIYNLQEEALDFVKELGTKPQWCVTGLYSRDQTEEKQIRGLTYHVGGLWSYTDAMIEDRSAKIKSIEYFRWQRLGKTGKVQPAFN